MFSTFSSFLPPVLKEQRSHQSLSTPNQDIPEPGANQQPLHCTAGDSKSKRKDKREKIVNETFIVVRPPPSISNHPLNLQVQFVPPQFRRDRPCATAQDNTSVSTDLQTSLETSTVSAFSCSASLSFFASSSATGSGRRMIIPLYNLQAHNVMTNVIVDAGTDAKVAKFIKRGLEIIGLAVLEPIEVWGNTALLGALPVPPSSSARASVDNSKRELGLFPRPCAHSSSSRPVTPDFSTTALPPSSSTDYPRKPSFTVTPSTPEETITSNTQPQRRGAKNLFAKLKFKKKDTSSQLLPVVVPTAAAEVQGLPSISRLSSRRSLDIPPSSPQVVDVPRPNDNLPTVTLCPSVLGIQPSLYPPISPPKGRPTKYVWVVRKWLKDTDMGLLNGVMGKLSTNGRGGLNGVSVPQVEVHFEWSRGRKKEKERGRRSRADRRSPPQGAEGESVSRRGNAVATSEPPLSRSVHRSSSRSHGPPSSLDASPTIRSQSKFSHHSASSEASTSIESSPHCADDSGDNSEPEDSETPWTCTLTLQHTGHPSPVHHSTEQQDNIVRLKVATLSPTPHHPKVIGLLKIPFPLPDIEVERLAVHRRVVTAQGVNRTVPNSGEFTLTAEEIKDAVSSTALWLVVREAFGGVGQERRKGDGWQIKA
ncbi:hypothetical protein DFH29DRAFT_853077 [Suillus ampliporus]|nr:hypothetical protein DFH29DRAFT_853077 [Suillus ampliporus]